jgi:hypothetical protein
MHVISGIWARGFLLCFTFLTVATFVGSLIYFLRYECTVNSLFLYGNSAVSESESSFVSTFLAQSNIQYCGAVGNINYVNIPTNMTNTAANNSYYVLDRPDCCSIDSGTIGDSYVCNPFETISNCLSATDDTPSCFNGDFNQVQIAYAECIAPTTAVVNSLEFSWYVALLVCLGYVAILVQKKYGFCGLFSIENWRTVFDNVEEVKRIRSTKLEMTRAVTMTPFSTSMTGEVSQKHAEDEDEEMMRPKK